eukprot:CFRG7418T1
MAGIMSSIRAVASSAYSVLPRLSSAPSVMRPGAAWSSPTVTTPNLTASRSICLGREYQPNNLQRKRKHGFLHRLETRGGKKVINRRRSKGRKFLSH